MRHRPLPIVVLALAHFLAPIANFYYSAYLMGASPGEYFKLMFADGQWHLNVPHFLCPVIAGFAIYKTKVWSYPVFLCAMTWMLVSNIIQWREFPQYFGLAALLVTFALNLGIVTYFLIPEVRKVYFNPKFRWWESQPRYDVSIPVELQGGEMQRTGLIQNISTGGVYAQCDLILFTDSEIDARFEAFGKHYALRAKIVHARHVTPMGYGLQFLHTPETQADLKDLVQKVRLSGAHERVGNAGFKDELVWLFKKMIRLA